jgi:hypothetical protein
MTRNLILALASASLVAGCSGGSGLATKYRSTYLLGGYSDKIVEPGMWKVTGRSNGVSRSGFGRDMAAYRAAEIVKAAGFSHMQVIAQKGKSSTVNGSSAGEFLTLTVRGVNDPSPPSDCREKQPGQCFTLAVDDVMARLRPMLGIDPERP